jgi:hypothetical protein
MLLNVIIILLRYTFIETDKYFIHLLIIWIFVLYVYLTRWNVGIFLKYFTVLHWIKIFSQQNLVCGFVNHFQLFVSELKPRIFCTSEIKCLFLKAGLPYLQKWATSHYTGLFLHSNLQSQYLKPQNLTCLWSHFTSTHNTATQDAEHKGIGP